MPLIVGTGIVVLLGLAVGFGMIVALNRKDGLMSQTGLGTLSFLLLLGLVLYVAGGAGI